MFLHHCFFNIDPVRNHKDPEYQKDCCQNQPANDYKNHWINQQSSKVNSVPDIFKRSCNNKFMILPYN